MIGHSIPQQARNTKLKRGRGAHILEDDHDRPLCRANDTAAALWELCDGRTTVDEMVAAIAELSSLPEAEVRDDVTRALSELAIVNAIEWLTPRGDVQQP